MIYTITFNPAIDYVVKVNQLNQGDINRALNEEIFYGGKGINVSIVLTHLELPNVALGFIAGFTGDAIKQGIEKEGIVTDFIKIEEGFSRINVKILASEESAINGQGPNINNTHIEKLFKKINQIKKDDILVLAGSIPFALPSDIYERILLHLQNRGIYFVVDATKDLLLNSLKYEPFLIKPNQEELKEIFEVELNTEEKIIFYARKLQDMGAKNVLVSRGRDGALLVTENNMIFTRDTILGKVENTVGAGDSMIAGFLAGWLERKDYEYALLLGSAAGIATSFSKKIATKTEIYNILEKLRYNTKSL